MEENYNTNITLQEVQAAISSIKQDSSPGPDNILPKMIKYSGEIIERPLLTLFQLCWDQGTVPLQWKFDNRIYRQKPGKPNYNQEKSYCSLSLNSVIGNFMNG